MPFSGTAHDALHCLHMRGARLAGFLDKGSALGVLSSPADDH
jgi:hypothetical protein